MKYFLLNILLLPCLSFSQENLIYNGSFEEYSSCPNTYNLWNGEFEKIKGWWSPCYYSTPDYFNVCANNLSLGEVGVPDNFWGHQFAQNGVGYIGFVPHDWNKNTGATTGTEYIQTKILEPLLPCQKYELSFYVSLANKSSHNKQYLEIGFTNDSTFYSLTSSPHCDIDPLVYEFFKVSIPTGKDTATWYRCNITFELKNSYSYLIIGDFSRDFDDTIYLQELIDFPQYYGVYYYMDNFNLVKSNELASCQGYVLPNIFTPNNDGINDFIDFTNFDKVTIINRWGNTVLIMDLQSNFEWHGRNFREEDLPDGVYFYIAEKAGFQQTGSIQLIR